MSKLRHRPRTLRLVVHRLKGAAEPRVEALGSGVVTPSVTVTVYAVADTTWQEDAIT